jgi:hypothetical protein
MASLAAPTRQAPPTPSAALPFYPLLVHTYLNGGKVKIYHDDEGHFTWAPHNKVDPNISGITSPWIPISTDLVQINLEMTFNHLRAAIEEIPEKKGRTSLETNSRKVKAAALYQITVLWESLVGVPGYTVIDAWNCERVLRLLANRRGKDMLVAVYVGE